MEITGEEGKQVVFDEHDGWEQVKGTEKMVDHRRWFITYQAVFLHKESGKHFRIEWPMAATEIQDNDELFAYKEPELVEVELREVTEEQWLATE